MARGRNTHIIWNGHLVGTSLGRGIHPFEEEREREMERWGAGKTEAKEGERKKRETVTQTALWMTVQTADPHFDRAHQTSTAF